MAETGKKASPEVSVSPTTDPNPDIARRDGERLETPDESRSASVLVKTVWPHGRFTVEGVPEVTSEGTKLTKTQLEQVRKAAARSGVGLEVKDL